MLSSINRLKKNQDFKKIYHKGNKTKGQFFDFFYLKSTEKYTRIGIVINSKIATLATERNKQKRMVRAYTSRHLKNSKEPIDIIIKIKKIIKGNEKKQAEKELQEQIQQILNVK